MKKCENCYYWEQSKVETDAGKCRRFPPIFNEFDSGFQFSYWPRVKHNDWCGEFDTKRLKYE